MKRSAQSLGIRVVLPPMAPTAVFSLRGLPEPVFKDAYKGETNENVFLLAQGLVDEGKISSMLAFVKEYGDLYHSLKCRGIADQIRLFEERQPTQKPKRAPLGQFSISSARSTELKGKEITERQMYLLICYVCFSLGTNKAVIGMACSDDTTIKNRMRQKLNGDREAGALFESCFQKLRTAGAVLELKKVKGFRMLAITNRPDTITDPAIKEAVSQALAEHRGLFNRN